MVPLQRGAHAGAPLARARARRAIRDLFVSMPGASKQCAVFVCAPWLVNDTPLRAHLCGSPTSTLVLFRVYYYFQEVLFNVRSSLTQRDGPLWRLDQRLVGCGGTQNSHAEEKGYGFVEPEISSSTSGGTTCLTLLA